MLEDGRVLQPGEVMQQSRSCMVCTCNGDTGEVDCERQNCPALDCGPEGDQPAEPGECCPRCKRKPYLRLNSLANSYIHTRQII